MFYSGPGWFLEARVKHTIELISYDEQLQFPRQRSLIAWRIPPGVFGAVFTLLALLTILDDLAGAIGQGVQTYVRGWQSDLELMAQATGDLCSSAKSFLMTL